MYTEKQLVKAQTVRIYFFTSLLFLVPCVTSEFFSVTSRYSKKCINIDVDFSVKVTAKYRGQPVARKTFSVDQVNKTEGSCLEPVYLSMAVISKSSELRFSFVGSDKVDLERDIILYPKEIFPHTEKSKGFVCFKGSTKTFDYFSSYVCQREEKELFHTTPCLIRRPGEDLLYSEYEYEVEMDTKRIHAQGHGIVDGFSLPGGICGEDDSKASVRIIVGSVIAAVFVLAVVAAVVVFLILRRNRHSSEKLTEQQQQQQKRQQNEQL